jgi:hypothetical protein
MSLHPYLKIKGHIKVHKPKEECQVPCCEKIPSPEVIERKLQGRQEGPRNQVCWKPVQEVIGKI